MGSRGAIAAARSTSAAARAAKALAAGVAGSASTTGTPVSHSSCTRAWSGIEARSGRSSSVASRWPPPL